MCGERKRTGFNSTAVGGWLCIACYRRELAPRVRCSRCRRMAPASVRLQAGRSGPALCERCYATTVHAAACSACREVKSIHTRRKGRPLCVECYARIVRKPEPCASCGRRKRVCVRDSDGSPHCRECHLRMNPPTEPCSRCGKLAHAAQRTRKGLLCHACYYVEAAARCAFCGETRRVATRLDDGRAVCGRCGYARLTPHRTCAVCRESKPTRRRTGAGEPICDRCHSRQTRRANRAGNRD